MEHFKALKWNVLEKGLNTRVFYTMVILGFQLLIIISLGRVTRGQSEEVIYQRHSVVPTEHTCRSVATQCLSADK